MPSPGLPAWPAFEPLPEMRLPAPAVVPPIVLAFELLACTPPLALGSAAVPAAFVPMRLPCTTVLAELVERWTPTPKLPLLPLPEIRFPAPLTVPPMKLPIMPVLNTSTPLCRFAMIAVPVMSVPM